LRPCATFTVINVIFNKFTDSASMVGVYFIEHVFSLLGGTCGHLIVGFLEFFSVQVTTAISVITPEYGRRGQIPHVALAPRWWEEGTVGDGHRVQCIRAPSICPDWPACTPPVCPDWPCFLSSMVVVFFVVDTIFNKFTFTNSASIVGIYFIEPPFFPPGKNVWPDTS